MVHDGLNDRSPVKPFLADLLADRTTATPGEPRDMDGAPNFVEGDDSVTEPEAMLFRDDLTVPIGRLPALIETLRKLVALAPSVCKLTVDINGTQQFGTAFRIGDRALRRIGSLVLDTPPTKCPRRRSRRSSGSTMMAAAVCCPPRWCNAIRTV